VLLVVDASVVVKCVVEEAGTPEALAIVAEHEILAPDLLLAESRNAILTKVRRLILTPEEGYRAERSLNGLSIRIVPSVQLLAEAFAIAMELGEPIYDCIYLAAALALDTKLITADESFARIVRRSAYGEARVQPLAPNPTPP
jgi:predicted nucleic acid-binding protein